MPLSCWLVECLVEVRNLLDYILFDDFALLVRGEQLGVGWVTQWGDWGCAGFILVWGNRDGLYWGFELLVSWPKVAIYSSSLSVVRSLNNWISWCSTLIWGCCWSVIKFEKKGSLPLHKSLAWWILFLLPGISVVLLPLIPLPVVGVVGVRDQGLNKPGVFRNC